MSNAAELKQKVCEIIESQKDEIIGIGEAIMDDPELGFKERNTAELVKTALGGLDLPVESGLAVTGVKAVLNGAKPGPTIAIMGELDALQVPGHPRAVAETDAADACGHNAQIAGLLGAAIGLCRTGAIDNMAGNVVFLAVPAEEYVEIEYRIGLVKSGTTSFLTGKQELARLGIFDDIDMAMMIHTTGPNVSEGSMGIGRSSNGFLPRVSASEEKPPTPAVLPKGVWTRCTRRSWPLVS